MSSQDQFSTPKKSQDVESQARQLVASPSTPISKVSNFNVEDIFPEKSQRQNEINEEQLARAHAALEQHQSLYEQNKQKLVDAIGQTGTVLSDLRDYNKNKRIIHYVTDEPKQSSPDSLNGGTLRRSQSVRQGNSLNEADVNQHPKPVHPSIQRCSTSQPASASLPNTPDRRHIRAASADNANNDDDDSDMSVLRLDIRVGSVSSNAQALVRSLERSSVAQLLDGRMEKAERHLENLKQRITDTQSKVLVTGDLNAGKSTFVNALLRRNLMPTDQQPCTTVFCEVLDASESNNGVEEVHMLESGVQYDPKNDTTFTRHNVDEVETIVAEAEESNPEDAPILKCYAHDTRSTQDSLLKNGLVDIALIDAPGLNRDSLKTTALFARQEEIDVVVFVVSAENHFTLSAKEFLWNASHDKAYVFIVVNKYDQIKNKEKCQKLVLEQIRQLSPRTFDDAENLVHFVDSNAVFSSDAESCQSSDEAQKVSRGSPSASVCRSSESLRAFARLEAALRDFVLLKRSKSKLLPSKTYMVRLLSDIAFLAKINTEVANIELKDAREALQVVRPVLAQCQANHAKLESVLEGEEDQVVSSVIQDVQKRLVDAIERIGHGQPAVDTISLPVYPGMFNIWQYAQEVRHTLTSSLELVLRNAEDSTRSTTSQAVDRVQKMGETHLPKDMEKRQRIFNPDAMFAKRRSLPGLVGLGLQTGIVQVQLSDFFDAYHHLSIVTGSSNKDKASKHSNDDELSLVSSFSLGLGALTLVGGKTLGAKTAIDAFLRVSDLVGNPAARKWAAPAFAIATTGLVVYFIVDLPYSIPRNIGRSMKSGLLNGEFVRPPSSPSTTEPTETSSDFLSAHSNRVSRETRKVLRLASWDLQERFRVAIAQRRAQVEKEEAKEKSASFAIEWFASTDDKIKHIQQSLTTVAGLEQA